MSEFYKDFENNHNEIFTKGFLNFTENFDYKVKFKPSENILLKGKAGLYYSYRIENNNETNINTNDIKEAKTQFYYFYFFEKFKFSNAILRKFEFKPNLINKELSFYYNHTSHNNEINNEALSESI